jgi:hypothetical protein
VNQTSWVGDLVIISLAIPTMIPNSSNICTQREHMGRISRQPFGLVGKADIAVTKGRPFFVFDRVNFD